MAQFTVLHTEAQRFEVHSGILPRAKLRCVIEDGSGNTLISIYFSGRGFEAKREGFVSECYTIAKRYNVPFGKNARLIW